MELVFVLAKLISGVLYELLRLVFKLIDALCDGIAWLIKYERKKRVPVETKSDAAAFGKTEVKKKPIEYSDMFPQEKDDAPTEQEPKRKEIDVEF